jgi:hypothetical protein
MLFIDGFRGHNGVSGFLISSMFAVLILMIAVYLIDNIGVEPVVGPGVVVASEFIPEYWTTDVSTTTVNNETTTTSTPVYHPDSWSMTIRVDDKTGVLEVSQHEFNIYTVEKNVTVRYIHGRITGGLYIRELLIAN